ncbi:MAG: acyltransferase family protein [Pyrinomonadaceae bacterium]
MSVREWFSDKFEISRGLQGKNVRPMEGLRGLAVSLVFLVHYVALVRPWIAGHDVLDQIAGGMHTIGNTGVDLFFVLSGYLIYGSLISKRQPFGRFIRRRVQRIYPTFIVVFAAYVLLSCLFPSEDKIPSGIWPAAEYLAQNFLLLPGIFSIEPMITVAWSLSYEMAFYFAIPVLIVVLNLREGKPAIRLAWFGAMIAVIIAASINSGPVQLILFVAGMGLFEAINSLKVRVPSSLAGAVALILGLAGTLLPFDGAVWFTVRTGMLFVAFSVVCLVCFCRTEGWFSRAFTWTPIRWLGNMSYSYYLFHGLTLKSAFLMLGLIIPKDEYGAAFFWSMLPAMFAVSLVPPAMLFLFVERPFSLVVRKAVQQDPEVVDNLPNPLEATS